MNMLKVKVCGLTEKINIKRIAEARPDIMGFIFYPQSKRYIGDLSDASIFDEIPSTILKAGVFVNEELHRINSTVKRFRLDMVQLHGTEPAEYCRDLKEKGMIIIKAFEMTSRFSFEGLQKYMDVCDYFLFDTKAGGSGLKFDWLNLSKYRLKKPFFLSGGIGPEDHDLIKSLNYTYLYAVDINSRFEISPGIKDPEKVRKFIDDIKIQK